MSDKITFPGVIVSVGMPTEETFAALNKATYEWEMRAARGECGWICSRCCSHFPEGMPDTCPHAANGCDEILQRDKREANKERT
ncbi:hypothetical protein PT7_P022 (plasmid) [Pusillimonas sp. T7-7]|uniref:hypothetical protein n=1 Tax=Pusillimonas sp. (strain T7-7) TaxID=1007105 RepID=UPI0002084A8D|nr:hypothetical protein [Pusillimonas sp. T7-7]AEC22258.1 hypothetical protein PT7_P022 [Pusillimonas sp. T7-7]